MNPTVGELPTMQAHATEVRRLIGQGTLVLLLGLLPIGIWATIAPLSSAVVAPAVVKVDSNRRPVQHVEGGTVREVRVRDGQQVREGEPLIILGDVSVDADMQRWEGRVNAERASVARLEAEQSLARSISFPTELLDATRRDPALKQLMDKERSLFDARRTALTSQVALLRKQREKVAQEMQALQTQIGRAAESLKLQNDELTTNRDLRRDGFISATRVMQLEAQVADYGVKLEERHSDFARAEQKLVDTDLRIKSLEGDYMQQASDQLKATLARLGEVQQEQRKTQDAAKRQAITAPAAGEIIGLKVTAPGGVIAPRDTIAEIVPKEQKLVVEAMLRPEDINRVHRNQHAEVRFTAFAYRTTKLVAGNVTYVSADRLVDKQANAAYFLANIEVDRASLRDAGDLQLLAGMPAEVFIAGEKRTPLQYLVEPLTRVLNRAARER